MTLELRSAGGTAIFRTSTALELAGDGSSKLAFEVPDLVLLGGDYDLVVGAARRGEEPAPDRTARFSVASVRGSEGVIDLRGSWRPLARAGELS